MAKKQALKEGRVGPATRFVALLRAINVGGRNVTMERLKGEFEEMGFGSVATFIASGNVIFEASEPDRSALERGIEARLMASLGYEVATFLRTPAELGEIAGARPFGDAAEGAALMISFLDREPDSAGVARLMGYRSDVDDFRVVGREVYWLCRVKVSESKFAGGALDKALGMPATMRSVTTVGKLAAKYGV
jgi:uncharacterized protein (DUF1697 family)